MEEGKTGDVCRYLAIANSVPPVEFTLLLVVISGVTLGALVVDRGTVITAPPLVLSLAFIRWKGATGLVVGLDTFSLSRRRLI
jgi:hypothetical protein